MYQVVFLILYYFSRFSLFSSSSAFAPGLHGVERSGEDSVVIEYWWCCCPISYDVICAQRSREAVVPRADQRKDRGMSREPNRTETKPNPTEPNPTDSNRFQPNPIKRVEWKRTNQTKRHIYLPVSGHSGCTATTMLPGTWYNTSPAASFLCPLDPKQTVA